MRILPNILRLNFSLLTILMVGTIQVVDAQLEESQQSQSTKVQATVSPPPIAEVAPAPAMGPVEVRQVIGQYCVTCHSETLKTAGLVLEHIDLDHISAKSAVWEKVVTKLQSGSMPPSGLPRPEKSVVDGMTSWITTTIDRAAAVSPNPGRPVVHRLNRVEYTNAIRDLLGIEFDGASMLPADNSGYGFDNIGDVLTVSPNLLERYIFAARKVVRIALGDKTLRTEIVTHKVSRMAWQNDRMSEDLPLGTRGGIAVRHYFPVDGDYILKLELLTNTMSGHPRGFGEKNTIDVRVDGELVERMTVGGPEVEQPQYDSAPIVPVLEVRLPVKAGHRLVQVAFLKKNWVVEGAGPEYLPVSSTAIAQADNTDPSLGRVEAGLENLIVEGPYRGTTPQETGSRNIVFTCYPTNVNDEASCAKEILTSFARRAYRRPLTDTDIRSLLNAYELGRSNEDSFEFGIQFALEKTLVAPDFLFRVERDPQNVSLETVYSISDIELASRLSFFLWSSIPDNELIDLAEHEKLRDSEVLEAQVKRMLLDPRSSALVENFFGQWLMLRNMKLVKPDTTLFPEFDYNLREAFQKETELFLESQLYDDRSVIELLNADYTFLNQRLAEHYGIPHIYGPRFRRIAYPDSRRAGLLGHGSILTVTSYANRTSPVLRGKFMLENILGTPPPPPPPNVPPFDEGDRNQKPKSVRERMEIHRKNPVCAACHAQLDPLGFAFENFNAIGGWRTMDGTSTIDASGAFPDGIKFEGPATFREALGNHNEQFVGVVVERLLTYALGRGAESYDKPAIRKIAAESAQDNHRWSSIILGIVKSIPFQMRSSEL